MSVSKAEFAWIGGDSPGESSFDQEIAGPEKESILNALRERFPQVSHSGAKLFAMCRLEGIAGRYKLTTADSEWFVRVSSRPGYPELERSITDYLFHRGVSVNPFVVSGATVEWGGRNYRADLRPFVDGRHFDGSTHDVSNIAHVLAECHQALAEFPMADEAKTLAAVRNQRLDELTVRVSEAINQNDFTLFAERAPWAYRNQGWLEELSQRFDPRLDTSPEAQCVHGEMHRANVLFTNTDQNAMLVDFEESPTVFMPVSWDLAFMFQRFCLWDNPSMEEALHRLELVKKSYRGPLPELAPMMSQIAWFTVVAILDLRVSLNVVTPTGEYDKFVRLQRQAKQYEGIL